MKVGQTVYIVATDPRNKGIKEAVVTKVGRKYFEVNPEWLGKYVLKTMMQHIPNYTGRYQAYESLQAISDEKEFYHLGGEIRKGDYEMTLEQAREIARILGIA